MVLAANVSCRNEATPHPQLLVVVDTDLPTLLQVEVDPSLSRDVAIDALRVDLIGADGSVQGTRDLIVPSPLDWPVSFGIEPATQAVTARLRVYRSSLATARLAAGATALEPNTVTTVDRLVALPAPSVSVSVLPVMLRGDCIGRPVSFAAPLTTCIDEARLASTPDVLQNGSAPDRTAAGTWAVAREVACTGPPPDADVICVPGGLTLMGDADLNGLSGQTLPYRLALVSPFYMDRTEVTVGRYRAALDARIVTKLPMPAAVEGVDGKYCVFTNATTTTKDAYPLNCLDQPAAATACRALGGQLTTEAQYEHASRGRGQGRRYPWGDVAPSCCTADLDRPICAPSKTLDLAGSHPSSGSCDGFGDESRDGILDLAGSLEEWMLDKFAEFSAPCWTWIGYRTDPRCDDASNVVMRGGSWQSGFQQAVGAQHSKAPSSGSVGTGFRCVYAGTP